MSLFEPHKLLFAFFVSLKVYEKDKSFQEGLDRLTKMPAAKAGDRLDSKLDQSRLDNSSRVSEQRSGQPGRDAGAPQSIARTSMPGKSRARGVRSRADQSDRQTAIDEERELA